MNFSMRHLMKMPSNVHNKVMHTHITRVFNVPRISTVVQSAELRYTLRGMAKTRNIWVGV